MTDSLPGVAASLRNLSGKRRWAAAFVCGLIFALTQPPLGLWPVVFLAGPALFWLWSGASGRSAFGVGLAFGIGYFALGMHWIVEPFLVHADTDGWMAAPALALISLGLGLFPATGFWLASFVHMRGGAAAPSFVAAWAGAEITRSTILTGFPWALPAYAWIDTPVAQSASLVGPYALTIATITAFVFPALGGNGWKRGAGACATVVVITGVWAWGSMRIDDYQTLDGPIIRIVQPNIGQASKWDVDLIRPHFEKTLALTARPTEGAKPSLVLWPESAVTFPIDMADAAREEIAAVAGSEVALGSLRVDGGPENAETQPLRWRNSLFLLDEAGALSKPFDKVHLVPFGEYLPFEGLLNHFGLLALAQRGSGIVPGEKTIVLQPTNTPPFAPLICYEMIFPREVMAASEGADWMALVTNDAWFGDWAGPLQHLAQAQMRAIETGLPIARAANTGVSAMIDPLGRVTASLAMNTEGVVDAILPAKRATRYREIGELGTIVLILILLGWAGSGFIAARLK